MICQQSEANINHASDPMSPSPLLSAAPSKPKLASDDDDEPLTMDNCVALSAYDDQSFLHSTRIITKDDE